MRTHGASDRPPSGQNQHKSAQRPTPLLMLRLPIKQRRRRRHPKKQSPQSCPSVCPSEPRSLWSGPGAAIEVQGRRRSHRLHWPAHARSPKVGPRWPLLVAIRADPPRSKPAELPVPVTERAAQPLVGPGGRQREPGLLSVPVPLTWRTATPPPGHFPINSTD